MKKKSIFHTTVLITISIFLFIGITVTVFMGYTLYSHLMSEYRSKGIAIAESIASSSASTILNTDSASMQATVLQFKQISGVAYVAVRDSNRHVFVHTFVPEIPHHFDAIHSKIINQVFSRQVVVQQVKLDYVGSVLDITAPILGGQLGFIHVGMDVSQIHRAIWKMIGKTFLIVFAILLASLALMRLFMKRVTSPLIQLTEYAKVLPDHNFMAPENLENQLKTIIDVSHLELSTLATAFLNLNQSLQTYVHSLKETTAAKERIESELAVARHIQLNMLPKPLGMESEQKDFHVYAYMNSAKEVGGDFYDFFVNEEKNVVFSVVGDVSGKGVPAALTMSICMSLIRSAAAQSLSPSDILASVNKQLCENNDSSQFVTVFLGMLNLKTGDMEYCLAGHLPPLITSLKSELQELPLTGGMALGLDPDFVYLSNTIQLNPDDQIVAFTDGVTEAENEVQNQYGEDSLKRLVSKMDQDPQHLCESIVSDVTQFANGTAQSDDLTLLIMKWTPQQDYTIGKQLKVHFINDLSELEKLQRVVEMYTEANELSTKVCLNVNLILEELLTNVILYGYQDHEQHLIYVTFTLNESGLNLEIEDDGIEFNPLERPEVDTTQLLEERSIGGLGIHFVRSLTRDIRYERRDALNFLIMDMDI